ncbi:MAG: DUF3313 family protein [Proteobacteria bacterium]|nr:DUF3313 family protein [Pseudomonadota bacterium]
MNYIFPVGRKLIPVLLILLFAASSLSANPTAPLYTKAGLNLSKYSKVLIKPLNIENIQVLKPVWEQDNPEVWTFDQGTGAAVQALFMDAMKQELETNGGYSLVTESASDTLRVEVELLSITPYVKPGTKSGDDGYEIETLGSGELILSAELRDSTSRELLMLVEGERAIGDTHKKLTRDNHEENLRQLFTTWAVNIRKMLDKDNAK